MLLSCLMVTSMSCLTSGGVDEGIDWLVECIKRNSDVRPPPNHDDTWCFHSSPFIYLLQEHRSLTLTHWPGIPTVLLLVRPYNPVGEPLLLYPRQELHGYLMWSTVRRANGIRKIDHIVDKLIGRLWWLGVVARRWSVWALFVGVWFFWLGRCEVGL